MKYGKIGQPFRDDDRQSFFIGEGIRRSFFHTVRAGEFDLIQMFAAIKNMRTYCLQGVAQIKFYKIPLKLVFSNIQK